MFGPEDGVRPGRPVGSVWGPVCSVWRAVFGLEDCVFGPEGRVSAWRAMCSSQEGRAFGLEGDVRRVGRRVRLKGREFRWSVRPGGLEFCLESGVPPGGPCFFRSGGRPSAWRVVLARRAACWSALDGREAEYEMDWISPPD